MPGEGDVVVQCVGTGDGRDGEHVGTVDIGERVGGDRGHFGSVDEHLVPLAFLQGDGGDKRLVERLNWYRAQEVACASILHHRELVNGELRPSDTGNAHHNN